MVSEYGETGLTTLSELHMATTAYREPELKKLLSAMLELLGTLQSGRTEMKILAPKEDE